MFTVVFKKKIKIYFVETLERQVTRHILTPQPPVQHSLMQVILSKG